MHIVSHSGVFHSPCTVSLLSAFRLQFGTIRCCELALKHMQPENGGSGGVVVNIGSVAGTLQKYHRYFVTTFGRISGETNWCRRWSLELRVTFLCISSTQNLVLQRQIHVEFRVIYDFLTQQWFAATIQSEARSGNYCVHTLILRWNFLGEGN